jgi:hypothetical protein
MSVSASLRTTMQGKHQAASTLQPTRSSRHTTTLDAEVQDTTAVSPLVTGRPYLFSHGKGRQGQAFGFRLTLEGRWGEAACR